MASGGVMMGFLLSFIPSRAKLYAIGAAAVAILLAVLRIKWKREGRKDLQAEQREDFIDRTDAARKAGFEAAEESKGQTPEERLASIRGNDRVWD